jgi:hypothetical protein
LWLDTVSSSIRTGRNLGDPDAAEVVARLQYEITAAVAALLEQEAPALDVSPEGHLP